MATKKSLSETFMDLINPAPLSFDPEDDEPESTAKIVENEESVSEEESAPSALRKRKFDFLEDGDERYDGTKVSRKSLNMEEHDSDSEVDIRNSADETEESENESNEEDIENSENEDSSQDKSEAESEDDRFEVASEDGFKHISNTNSELEIEKSIAVKNQLNLWDNLLECRITLQKSLSAANKLPQCSTFQQFTSSGGSKFITETVNTKKSLSTLLEKLITLQTTMLDAHPEANNLNKTTNGITNTTVASDEEITSDSEEDEDEEEGVSEENFDQEHSGGVKKQYQVKKRSLKEYSKLLGDQHNKYKDFWNAVIQKWNDKTRMSVGKLSSQNFSNFEQSTLKQIEQVLSNRQRLIQRTQLKRSSYNILGEDLSDGQRDQDAERDLSLDNKEPNDSLQNKEYNCEIFDDTDFYHQLLRELIERKSSGVTDPVQLGRQWLQLQKLRSKMKRKVDTRATKGRKIRYVVHSKLVNFMAPEDKGVYTEEAKTELFNSLFGNNRR